MLVKAGVAGLVAGAMACFTPPSDMRPSEWAERNVSIPAGNAVPGLIQFDNAPYQREPLDMTANPDCHRVTLKWSAQVGKTQLGLCAQGFRIGQDPTSQMMMQPSQGDLQTWLETKFDPMCELNPEIGDLIAVPRARKGANNQRIKSYPGGFLMFAWAGSPKTARGRSAPFIVCDEVDGYQRSEEGHPVSLLWQRAGTFGDLATLLEISTPTIKGASYIDDSWESGDKRRFYVPCPHCRHRQTLRWGQVIWDKDADGEHLPETAAYVCEECGVAWSDGDRLAAVRDPEAGWVAERPFRGHASYHLNEIYSMFRRLSQIVQSFIDKKRTGDLQTFVNVSLAETWEGEGDRADSADMMARAVAFDAPVPLGVGVLTAGVDMQQDRLEVEVVGWGLGEESWSVEYRVIWGDPLQADVWQELDEFLGGTWTHVSGAELSITSAAIDTGGSGGLTQCAYDFVRGKLGRRIFGIKGRSGWGRPVVAAPSKVKTRRNRPISLFPVGVDEAKVVVMRRWGMKTPGPGYCWVPDSRDPEWFAQACAETLRIRYVRGFPIREWHQDRPRNEALDCRVYAYAALRLANPNLARAVARIEPEPDEEEAPAAPAAELAGADPTPASDAEPEPEAPRAKKRAAPRAKKRRRGGSGWVNGW